MRNEQNNKCCFFRCNRNRFIIKFGSMLEFQEMDSLNAYMGKLDWCLDNTQEHFTVRLRKNREKRIEWFNSEFRVLRMDKTINRIQNRISTGFLLDNWNTVGNIQLRIINRPLEIGIFLGDWKESMVMPVEKKYY